MSQKDKFAWNAFIAKFPDFCNECYYNFRVGEGVTINTEFEPNIMKMVKAVSQLRIDVITIHDDYLRIIELKPYGSCTALGQLAVYNQLMKRKYANLFHIIPTLVCFRCPEDIATVLDHYGFDLYTVDVPENVQL